MLCPASACASAPGASAPRRKSLCIRSSVPRWQRGWAKLPARTAPTLPTTLARPCQPCSHGRWGLPGMARQRFIRPECFNCCRHWSNPLRDKRLRVRD
jgi:hypothetical protein